jgi:molybdopterin-containing oxidoreductase family iron-sulfur binding subunit
MIGTKKSTLDIASVRQRLMGTRGREYWRSLEELADTEEFQEFLRNEFPRQAAVWAEGINRRDALRLIGASLALAGMTACTSPPADKIVPYVRAPEDFVPGKPLYYATAMTLGGYATGLLVESHLGRPTKIEGNERHPSSLGATDAFAQASVLTLYDPDRSQVVMHNGRIGSWISLIAALGEMREAQKIKKGSGLRILTETITSPTLASQIQALLADFPMAKWHQYEPLTGDGARAGSRMAFGSYVNTVYDFSKADVILSLDADFLTTGPGHLRYAREWAERRKGDRENAGMNRLYVAECLPTSTGAAADHRLPVRASQIEGLARVMARELGIAFDQEPQSAAPGSWISAVSADLKQHRGRSVVIPGACQPAIVHALAHAMNHELGNPGSTVFYTEPAEARPVDQIQSLLELVEDMKAGAVDSLIILGGNPIYDAPQDFDFALNFNKVKQRIHLSLYEDETSRLCHWHIPEAHYLEAWSDARAHDGTVTIMQPLIAPLYGGKSAHEILAVLQGRSGVSGYDLLREYWKLKAGEADFERFWQSYLNEGLIAGSAFPVMSSVTQDAGAAKKGTGRGTGQAIGLKKESLGAAQSASLASASSSTGMEIVFRPDPTILDGRFANNGWLQELPKPLTKLTWENAAHISPATAERLGLHSREVIEIAYAGSTLRAPVWIMPGHAADCVTVHLGYGRSNAGRVGNGAGFNVYPFRRSGALWFGPGAELRKTGSETVLACTQNHHSMEGRNPVREGTLGEFKRNPEFAREMGEEPPRDLTLYPGFEYKGYAWGMIVNLGTCIGCNACVVACQAENNIPIVGKTQVNNGREMHWIRIDRYHKGDLDSPSSHFQPVMCQHCENAPCELVCPVQATSHSSEGLNQMVYNRCVGTRYCSNNCPYKVRRFNFLQFTDWETPSMKPLRNPDVSVRGRGVMEKCTFCVQRINEAKIQAEKEDRQVKDGEIVTACQASCPTGAIVFGNINDPESRVSKLKSEPLNYGLLAELNTRPRTSYLARLRNPNPALEKD